MRRRWATLLLCMAMSTVMLTYTGCGSDDKAADAETAEESEIKEDKESAEDSETADNAEEAEADVEATEEAEPEVVERELTEDQKGWSEQTFATIEEFLSYEQMQQQIESMKAGLETSGMSMEVVGEDNKLIYRFTYLEQTKTDDMKAALESQLTSVADTYVSIANILKAAVAVENPVVVVTYIDANGEEIHSQEFAAE